MSTYLDSFDELLGMRFKFPLAIINLIRAGNNYASWANGGFGQVSRMIVSHRSLKSRRKGENAPTSHGKKVARNWNILLELVEIVPLRVGIAHWQATGNDREWRRNVEIECRLHIGCILAGEDGASVDSLALGDCI